MEDLFVFHIEGVNARKSSIAQKQIEGFPYVRRGL